MARRPRAPVLLSMARWAISLNASGVNSKRTYKHKQCSLHADFFKPQTKTSHKYKLLTYSHKTIVRNLLYFNRLIHFKNFSILMLKKWCNQCETWQSSRFMNACCNTIQHTLSMIKYNTTYLIHEKESLELGNESIAGFRENAHEHLLIKRREGCDDRETTNKLGDHAKLNEVTSLNKPQHAITLLLVTLGVRRLTVHPLVSLCRCTSTLLLTDWCSKTQVLQSNTDTDEPVGTTVTGELKFKLQSSTSSKQ